MTRLRSALAATALLLPLGAAVVATAPAAVAEGCSASEVTVLVDFASLGGGVQTGCTGGDPASGVEALQAAGFPPTRAAAERSGYFMCRISGKPADDPCQRASPAGASWSYWHAQPGGSWSYSSQGAGAYDPPAGTVEGWSFGAGDPPSAPPPRTAAAPAPAASSPTAAPGPTAAATPAPPGAPPATAAAPARPAGPTGSPGPTGAAAGTPTGSPTAAASAEAAAPGASPDAPPDGSSASPDATGPTPDRDDLAADPTAQSGDAQTPTGQGGGGLVAALAAAGLVLVLGGGALLQSRRRRPDTDGTGL